jgi:hypothetical protein
LYLWLDYHFSYHAQLQSAYGAANGLCYRNYFNFSNLYNLLHYHGLPADTTFPGGTDLGISANVNNELVFFFGDFYNSNGGFYGVQANGDPFGFMPLDDDTSTSIDYSLFTVQGPEQSTSPLPTGPLFTSIIQAVSNTDYPAGNGLFTDLDLIFNEQEFGGWTPSGAYFDHHKNKVYLWYSQWILSNLIEITAANTSDFTAMHVVRNPGQDPNRGLYPFAKNNFLSVAPAAFDAVPTNPLGLPDAVKSLNGALLFGTGCDRTPNSDCHGRNSAIYVGFFVPPTDDDDCDDDDDDYQFLVMADIDDDTTWDPVACSDQGQLPARPHPVVLNDVNNVLDGYGELSVQKIAIPNSGGREMLVLSADHYLGSNSSIFELRVAAMDTYQTIETGLRSNVFTNTDWGYGDYLVDGSLALVPYGVADYLLYYDRVVTPGWGNNSVGIHYGTAVIKSVAHIRCAQISSSCTQ